MTSARSRLPQLPRKSEAVVRSVEWVYEPFWHGERLIAEVRDGRVNLTDATGAPAGPDLGEAAEVLERALVDADGAVIDGVWTSQRLPGDGGTASQPAEAEPRRAFVAVDLVELDGAPLHDIPFLERRRLLASVLEENAWVRISPSVQLPIAPWLEAWRSNGFDAYVAKHINSRYRPGEIAEDWLKLPTTPARVASPVGRLFGNRAKHVVHVEDDGAGGARPPRR